MRHLHYGLFSVGSKAFYQELLHPRRPHPGRSISKESQINTAAVNSLIDECSNLSCAEIASAISLSKSTIHWILTTVLNYRNVFAVWVPSELTEEQKCQRLKCCKAILDMFRTHPLEYIVSHYCVEDESWFTWDAESSWKNWISKGKNKPQLPDLSLQIGRLWLWSVSPVNQRGTQFLFYPKAL